MYCTASLLTLLGFAALAAAATTHTVTVAPAGRLVFAPAALTIAAGDSVQFKFPGSGHTVTHGEGCRPGGEFNLSTDSLLKFDDAGTFPYFCSIGPHCMRGMTGVVTVRAAADKNAVGVPAPPPASMPSPPVPAPTPTAPPEPDATLTVHVPGPTKAAETAATAANVTCPGAALRSSIAPLMFTLAMTAISGISLLC